MNLIEQALLYTVVALSIIAGVVFLIERLIIASIHLHLYI